MKTPLKAALILGAISCLVMVGFLVEKQEDASDQEEPLDHERLIYLDQNLFEKKGIILHQVKKQILKQSMTIPGRVVINADAVIHFIPQAPGIVKAAKKNIGEMVKPSDVLAVIESRELAEARAAYRGALKTQAFSAENFEREKELFSLHLTSLQDYQTARSELIHHDLDLALATQKLLSMGLSQDELKENREPESLSLYLLRSPIEGTIIEKNIYPGEYVDATKEVYKIADLRKVWGEIALYPKDLIYLKRGDEVEIEDLQGNKGKAQVEFISPIVGEQDHLVKGILIINNFQEQWPPGSFLYVHLQKPATQEELMIPKTAIQTIEGHECVFTLCSEGFQPKRIQVGAESDQFVQILSGLTEDETIASGNTFILKADLLKDEAVDDD